MIDKILKEELLVELSKTGNVCISCMKSHVGRATFYRWVQNNKEFAKQAKRAIHEGRQNMTDIAEHALLLNVKKGDMRAITYTLSHNSSRYKNRKTDTMVHIIHEKKGPSEPNANQPKTLADLIGEVIKQKKRASGDS